MGDSKENDMVWLWCTDRWPDKVPYNKSIAERAGMCPPENQRLFPLEQAEKLRRYFSEGKFPPARSNQDVSEKVFQIGCQPYTVDYLGDDSKGNPVFAQRAIRKTSGKGVGRWRLLKRVPFDEYMSRKEKPEEDKDIFEQLKKRILAQSFRQPPGGPPLW